VICLAPERNDPMNAMTSDSFIPSKRVKIAAFYKFVEIDEPALLQRDLRKLCQAHGVKGTILIAHEGINATVSASDGGIAALENALRSDRRFSDVVIKFSEAAGHPFKRLKVKIKREIVTFGAPEARPSITSGRPVEPENWNALISDPDVLVIDTRNDYEVEIGTFEGARNPNTRAFGEFRDYVTNELASDPQRKIAMFCTGGIRCEKASAYLLSQGFTDVHQLSGGILKYLEKISPSESLWRGECFVFDERVALEHGVRQGRHCLCAKCGRPRKLGDPQGDDTLLCDACSAATPSNAG
jgi:UPF0176 protein